MDIYVPNFDAFEQYIHEQLAIDPNDACLKDCKALLDNQGGDEGVFQLAADCSNIEVTVEKYVFSVIQLHSDSWQYPESFFDDYQLVMTMNFAHTRLDVFCLNSVDPKHVYYQLIGNMAAMQAHYDKK